MQILHGYNIDEKQWKAGNGGQYNVATKDGKEYCIKRLTSPRYPVSDNFKGEFKQKKIDLCNEWLRCRQEIINAIPGYGTGTMVKPIEYFREESFYYEVSNLIDSTSIPYDELYKAPYIDKVRIMLQVARSLSDIHKRGVVHGNLKPENILIYPLPERHNFVVRVIGFEDSFFENKLPDVIPSESTWQSPEVIRYNQAVAEKLTPNPYRKDISCKLDVYSLGLVFYLYCTGTLPFDEMNLGNRKSWQVESQQIEPEFKDLIADMLEDAPSKRPTMEKVFNRILHPIYPKDSEIREYHEAFELMYHSNSIQDIEKASDVFRNLGEFRNSKEYATMCQQKIESLTQPLPSQLVATHGVKSVHIHPRNSRKVVLLLENGQERIMDKDLAMKMGYVKKGKRS